MSFKPMSYKPENPRAFPLLHHDGMSLRDYFAGQALAALADCDEMTAAGIAQEAYSIADAMLKAREAS